MALVGTLTGGLCEEARQGFLKLTRKAIDADRVFSGYENWLPEQWAWNLRVRNSFLAVKATAMAAGVRGASMPS